jgi:uncharacterized protein with PIN domain
MDYEFESCHFCGQVFWPSDLHNVQSAFVSAILSCDECDEAV